MPNISTCDTAFLKNTIAKNDKAVAIAWSESANMNDLVEKVSELENSGIPVFVLDCDSCGKVAEDFKVKPGDTVIFKNGSEVGRLNPNASLDENIAQIKNITSR